MDDIKLSPEAFREPGLYLMFQDGHTLALTRSVIEQTAEKFLADESWIPDAARTAQDVLRTASRMTGGASGVHRWFRGFIFSN